MDSGNNNRKYLCTIDELYDKFWKLPIIEVIENDTIKRMNKPFPGANFVHIYSDNQFSLWRNEKTKESKVFFKNRIRGRVYICE